MGNTCSTWFVGSSSHHAAASRDSKADEPKLWDGNDDPVEWLSSIFAAQQKIPRGWIVHKNREVYTAQPRLDRSVIIGRLSGH